MHALFERHTHAPSEALARNLVTVTAPSIIEQAGRGVPQGHGPCGSLSGGTRAAAGAADARIWLSRRVFERIRRFLYAEKKVFAILGLKWLAGRPGPGCRTLRPHEPTGNRQHGI